MSTEPGVFIPISRNRAFEAVVKQIETAIYDGTYKAGDNLPSERALVDQFEVGRSTVREALRILESMGLIKTSAGSQRGARVSASMTQGISRMINGAVRVEEISLVDLVQYRMMTGGTANLLAAHLRSDEHLDAMESSLKAMGIADAPAGDFARADADFHSAIRKATGNSLMTMINEAIEGAVVEMVEETLLSSDDARNVRERFVQHHRQVLDAIRARDGVEAARLSRSSLVTTYGPLLNEDERARLDLLLS
jgi:GntR family transcriptional repressor for pyruvate dehydrogenase complex